VCTGGEKMSIKEKRKNIFIRLYEIYRTIEFLFEKEIMERIIIIKFHEFNKAKESFRDKILEDFTTEEWCKFEYIFNREVKSFDYFPYNDKYMILQQLETNAIKDLFIQLHNVYDSSRNSKNSLHKCLEENSNANYMLEKQEYKDLVKIIKNNRNSLIAHQEFVENIELERRFEGTGYKKVFGELKIKENSINRNLHKFRFENRVDLIKVKRLVDETLDILEKEWADIRNTIEHVPNPFEGFILSLTEGLEKECDCGFS